MSSTTITNPFLTAISAIKFTKSADINTYFTTKTGSNFTAWFNAHIAQKENWGPLPHRNGVTMATDPDAISRFNLLWDQIPVLFGSSPINLLQFVALISIVNNETGGKLKPTTELVGSAGNPGLAYAFNSIPGTKRSYNTLSSNKNAYDLFHDAVYKTQHGSLALGNTLKDTTNIAWKGEVYPAGIDTSTDPAKTGFVMEADFFKFRGRGFIQTTGRSNYKPIIDFILHYNGTNAIVNQYKTKWQGKDSDTVATISTNKDWDILFQTTDLIIPAAAINMHSKSAGNYLTKITLQPGIDANIKAMGKAISGTNEYGNLFLSRVIQILNGLGN
jgi:hypothetical protein